MVACAKVIVFLAVLLCFSLLLKNTIKIGCFEDFDMLIFSFLGQKSRVNNLATVGSITWPHFLQNFWKMWPSYWPYSFHMVFWYNLFFFKNHILPAERRIFFWKKTEKHLKKVAKLLTYGGQVIDPTAYIYIYIGVIIGQMTDGPFITRCFMFWSPSKL